MRWPWQFQRDTNARAAIDTLYENQEKISADFEKMLGKMVTIQKDNNNIANALNTIADKLNMGKEDFDGE